VDRGRGAGEILRAEIAGAAAGVEAFQAEVDRVGAGLQSGLEAGGISGGG
jgi:hypothetical protein